MMSFLSTMLATAISMTVGKILEYFRQRDLEKKAARAADLEKHVSSINEADAVATEIIKSTSALAAARIQARSAEEKLRKIREWNAKARGSAQ